MSYHKVDITNLQNGEAVTLFNEALLDVIRNIQDPNTEIDKPRRVILKADFIPQKQDPSRIDTSLAVETKLAPKITEETVVTLSHDEGEVGFFEDDGVQGDLFPGEEPRVVSINS